MDQCADQSSAHQEIDDIYIFVVDDSVYDVEDVFYSTKS